MKSCVECSNYNQNEGRCYPFELFDKFVFSYKINNPYSEDNCSLFSDKQKFENEEKLKYNINKDEKKGEENESANSDN